MDDAGEILSLIREKHSDSPEVHKAILEKYADHLRKRKEDIMPNLVEFDGENRQIREMEVEAYHF